MGKLIPCIIICLNATLFADWITTEIPVPSDHTVDQLHFYTIDDYGNFYWQHRNQDCDSSGSFCTVYNYTLYRYDWASNNVSTVVSSSGSEITFYNSEKSYSGKNVVWDQNNDLYLFDGNDITQLTNTPSVAENILCVTGDSVYYQIVTNIPSPNYDLSYTLYHAVKVDAVSQMPDCSTVRSFGYKLDSDLSGDCYVNLEDFSLFALEWLECNDPSEASCLHPWES